MDERAEYRVLYYETPVGDCPAEEFILSLPEKVRGKLFLWQEKLEIHGPGLTRPYTDIVSGKIRELRLVFASQQYRFLYFFSGKDIIITHGFLKKTGPVPRNEIERAQRYMLDYEKRIEL